MPLVLHRGNDRRARTAGFTLVELSVVIFMMGLLAALLLPALSTAKEKSRRAVCQSNIHQLLQTFVNFANQNEDLLPSSLDNLGFYHSIRLSDVTFTNLVAIAGSSNIFYCPNIVFGPAGPGSVVQQDSYGYVIGYNYLANAVEGTIKGNATWVAPTKFTDSPTNELIADANYWSLEGSSGSFPGGMKVAPHGAMGASIVRGSSFTVGLKPGATSVGIGAVGGNIGFLDSSVTWRNIRQMQTFSASSLSDGQGNW
jgi:prepilin-type N-terminal cleavage/methylation domain-containing protein